MTVNNTFVHGVTLLADQRDDQLRFTKNENSKKLSMMAFLLVNVFFGIVGTFWLRTERRRSEIGLRMAIGSSRGRLGEYMYLEGLGLLAITVPILLVFVFNMAFWISWIPTASPSPSLRFLVTLSVSYLLMAGMICMGIWFPVRKAVKMAPAERCITNKLSIFASVNSLMRKEQAYDSYRIKNVVTARGDVLGG